MPNRPRYPLRRPYHPPSGLSDARPNASTVPSAAGLLSSAAPSGTQPPCATSQAWRSSIARASYDSRVVPTWHTSCGGSACSSRCIVYADEPGGVVSFHGSSFVPVPSAIGCPFPVRVEPALSHLSDMSTGSPVTPGPAAPGRMGAIEPGGAAMSELDGVVAIVTGSSSGIGERTAQRLSALGATVVVNSASSVEAGQRVADALPVRRCTCRPTSATRPSANRSSSRHVAAFGRLDLLVNNAGWTTLVPHDDLDALTDEIFRKTFEVNVFGTWYLTKAAMPLLRQSPDGHVVNITSVAGVRPLGSSIAYSMTKAALNQMTRLLAKSHGPVRVNAVAPGLVETPWTADWAAQHAGVAFAAPLKRSATPDDCAEAVLALVRNKYVTGEVFVVDGGLTQVS